MPQTNRLQPHYPRVTQATHPQINAYFLFTDVGVTHSYSIYSVASVLQESLDESQSETSDQPRWASGGVFGMRRQRSYSPDSDYEDDDDYKDATEDGTTDKDSSIDSIDEYKPENEESKSKSEQHIVEIVDVASVGSSRSPAVNDDLPESVPEKVTKPQISADFISPKSQTVADSTARIIINRSVDTPSVPENRLVNTLIVPENQSVQTLKMSVNKPTSKPDIAENKPASTSFVAGSQLANNNEELEKRSIPTLSSCDNRTTEKTEKLENNTNDLKDNVCCPFKGKDETTAVKEEAWCSSESQKDNVETSEVNNTDQSEAKHHHSDADSHYITHLDMMQQCETCNEEENYNMKSRQVNNS